MEWRKNFSKKTTQIKKTMWFLSVVLLWCFVEPIMAEVHREKKNNNTFASSAISEQDERFNALYLESVVEREKGNRTAQFELLRRALEIKPDASEALFDLAETAQQGSALSDGEISALYRKAVEKTNQENADYLESYGRYEMIIGKYEEAIPIFQKLTKNELKRKTAYQMLVTTYERQQRYDDLLHTLDEWTQTTGEDEDVENMKMKTLDHLKRYDDELAVVDKLIRENPDNDYYFITKAQTLLQKGDTLGAWKGYEQVVAKDSGNLSAQMFRVIYFQSTKNEQAMMNAMEDVILNNEQPTEMRVSLMKSMVSSLKGTSEERRISRLFERLMEEPLDDRALPELYAQYLASKNEPDSAFVPAMKKIVEIDSTDDQARLILIQDALNRRAYGEVVTKCKDGIRINPAKLLYYHLCGGALYQQKQYRESLEMFEKGLPYVKSTKDKEMVSNFFSSYADALHEGGAAEKAYACYDSALVYNPVNVICLNNYAYFLSLSGDHLDRAQQMSERVLKIEPNNPTYLDTYAWILFMRKNYDQARAYMEQALKLVKGDNNEDASLYEHAGDIYIELGRKKEAQEAWRKALKLGSTSKSLKKKIKTSKYYQE
jgi:tetratricopeptide (TPR) repeat protein